MTTKEKLPELRTFFFIELKEPSPQGAQFMWAYVMAIVEEVGGYMKSIARDQLSAMCPTFLSS